MDLKYIADSAKIGKKIKSNPCWDYFSENTIETWKNYLSFKNKKKFEKRNKEIKKYKDIHKDERGFIIATGPSLNKTDFSKINGEILIGVNSLFKALNQFDIKCKYWSVCDIDVFDAYSKNLLNLDVDAFFLSSWAALRYVENEKKFKEFEKYEPILIKRKPLKKKKPYYFTKDLKKGIMERGVSVVVSTLQIAYYMGFKEVYLLGCDCDYSGQHHFDGKKHKFNIEKKTPLSYSNRFNILMERYEICKKAFEADGRKIYNATVGGKLEVFERKRLEDII